MAMDREDEGRAKRRWRLLREAIIRAAAVADEHSSTPTTTAYAVPGLTGGAVRLHVDRDMGGLELDPPLRKP